MVELGLSVWMRVLPGADVDDAVTSPNGRLGPRAFSQRPCRASGSCGTWRRGGGGVSFAVHASCSFIEASCATAALLGLPPAFPLRPLLPGTASSWFPRSAKQWRLNPSRLLPRPPTSSRRTVERGLSSWTRVLPACKVDDAIAIPNGRLGPWFLAGRFLRGRLRGGGVSFAVHASCSFIEASCATAALLGLPPAFPASGTGVLMVLPLRKAMGGWVNMLGPCAPLSSRRRPRPARVGLGLKRRGSCRLGRRGWRGRRCAGTP